MTDRPARWLYTLGDRVGAAVVAGVGSGLLASLVVGSILGATTGRFDPAGAVAIGVSIGLVCALVAGLFGGKAEAISGAQRSIGQIGTDAVVGWFVVGLVSSVPYIAVFDLYYGLADAFIAALAGALAGALVGRPGMRPRAIAVIERVRWSWTQARRFALVGLAVGLANGLGYGLIYVLIEGPDGLLGRLSYGITGGPIIGIVSGLVGGLAGAPLETTARPNQGIRRSAENMLRGALVYALAGALGAGLVYALVGGPRPFLHMVDLPPSTGLFVDNHGANPPGGMISQFSGGYAAGPIYGLIYGAIYCLVAALIGTLAFGGYACISHLMLRLVLWRQKAMPWDYADFLDYCVRRVFLRRVGGGYIFVHRLLMEYFATLPSESPPVSAPEPTPPVSTREA